MLKTLIVKGKNLLIIFVFMAKKLKGKSTKDPVDKPGKTKSDLKTEKEEKINLKEIAHDERTWKIIGFIFLFMSLFLFISFIAYVVTWENDQSEIRKISLFGDNANIHNLLGAVGALISHFFIYKGFGVASLLICTFFFVVGVNLLFRKKVWSVWRNLRYVTVGMLVLSVCLAFVFASSQFSYGGSVGKMIVDWLQKLLGSVGTGALLVVLAMGYIIWQFNPAFNVPKRKKDAEEEVKIETEVEGKKEEEFSPIVSKTINDVYAENGNSLKTNGEQIVLSPVNLKKEEPGFTLIEREEEPILEMIQERVLPIPPVEEPVQTILPQEEIPVKRTPKEKAGNSSIA